MSLGLSAPLAVPVEVRGTERRVFRKSRSIGAGGIELCAPAPFEVGSPVTVRLQLPDADTELALRAEVTLLGDDAEAEGEAGGCRLLFIEPSSESRALVGRYVTERLGLPPMPF